MVFIEWKIQNTYSRWERALFDWTESGTDGRKGEHGASGPKHKSFLLYFFHSLLPTPLKPDTKRRRRRRLHTVFFFDFLFFSDFFFFFCSYKVNPPGQTAADGGE